MLYLNFQNVFALRGIDSPFKFLRNSGFTANIAHRILNQADSYIKYQYLEKLCLLLHCTPNDLLEWRPDAHQRTLVDEPLSALTRPNTAELINFMKNAPLEKLNEMHKLMKGL